MAIARCTCLFSLLWPIHIHFGFVAASDDCIVPLSARLERSSFSDRCPCCISILMVSSSV